MNCWQRGKLNAILKMKWIGGYVQNWTNCFVTQKRLGTGGILLCLLMFFAACAQSPLVQSRKTEKELPPASLLLQSQVTDWPLTATNGELLELAKTWRRQLLECNADKASIEAWSLPTAAENPTAAEKKWFEFWK